MEFLRFTKNFKDFPVDFFDFVKILTFSLYFEILGIFEDYSIGFFSKVYEILK